LSTIETATASLADAIWWFKGFSAGTDSPSDSCQAAGLAEQLRQVREWLERIEEGKARLLVDSETRRPRWREGGIVAMSYADFERILDGLKGNPSEQDRALALETMAKILAEWNAEDEAISRERNDDIPF
jgi:hypothetical protein